MHVGAQTLIAGLRRSLTHLEALRALDRSRNLAEARQWLDDLPLRVHAIPAEVERTLDTVPEDYKDKRDPELHAGLQDLAYQITWDIHEACAAISDPNIYFAGVDEGVEPVTNEHIRLAIWGCSANFCANSAVPPGPRGCGAPRSSSANCPITSSARSSSGAACATSSGASAGRSGRRIVGASGASPRTGTGHRPGSPLTSGTAFFPRERAALVSEA